MTVYMRKYLKYILMRILAVTLSSIFFKKKTEAETSLPRDYAEIAASGILRAVTEYNSISFYADGDTVSGFHYELLHAFAHSKALATGNPAVKEKMALDVDVAKLKLLKANHMNNQYRLEDDIVRNFPQQIAKLTEIIASYKADIAHFSEHKITDPEQFSMEISGKVFTEKKEAGAALLAVCKDIKSVDAAMDIGSYQGFNMRIQFDSWSKEFILSVKHESVAKVRLGADALGNITRINNLLESYPEKLAEAEQRLETVQEQMTNAKEEVGKPFPKEEELNQKLERLSELNALLNMDEREDTETEQSESKEKEERPARGSIHEKLQIYKEKSQRESETGKETRKRDFGLE